MVLSVIVHDAVQDGLTAQRTNQEAHQYYTLLGGRVKSRFHNARNVPHGQSEGQKHDDGNNLLKCWTHWK